MASHHVFLLYPACVLAPTISVWSSCTFSGVHSCPVACVDSVCTSYCRNKPCGTSACTHVVQHFGASTETCKHDFVLNNKHLKKKNHSALSLRACSIKGIFNQFKL